MHQPKGAGHNVCNGGTLRGLDGIAIALIARVLVAPCQNVSGSTYYRSLFHKKRHLLRETFSREVRLSIHVRKMCTKYRHIFTSADDLEHHLNKSPVLSHTGKRCERQPYEASTSTDSCASDVADTSCSDGASSAPCNAVASSATCSVAGASASPVKTLSTLPTSACVITCSLRHPVRPYIPGLSPRMAGSPHRRILSGSRHPRC